MARYTGSAMYLAWITSAGTTALQADYRSVSVSESLETADSTAGADTYKSYIGTFADATAEVELLDTAGTAGTAQWAAVAPNTSGTLLWAPSGTASNAVYWTAPAFVSQRDREFPYDDVVSVTLGFQLTSSPTTAKYS